MICVTKPQYSIQAPLGYENPFDLLDDHHMAKIIVSLVSMFKKENPSLFKEKDDCSRGPKIKYTKSEMLGLYIFATFRGQRSCRRIADWLTDHSKACQYITNNKYPKKSKINQFKNECGYLIDKFLKFTVDLGFNFGLVDFKIITIDSTPIEAYVNEFRIMSIKQINYLENLIHDLSFKKSTKNLWNKIKRYFHNDELPDEMIDLIDEIYHNLNRHGRELLQLALCSKKACNMVLDVLGVLKENYDGKHYVNLTDPESRKMHMKDDTKKFAYLLQTVKDTKTGLIIMQKVVQDKTDRYQLKPAIDYIIETYNVIPDYILADNGYYGLDQIEHAYSKGITPIIPDRNDAMKNNNTQNDNPYAKCNWPFNTQELYFTCPYNQKLTPQEVKIINDQPKLMFRTDTCPNCPYKKECAKKSKYRTLYEPLNPYFFDRKRVFLSKKGKLIYKFRAIHSEGGFAELKSIQEFKQSKRRGLKKVEIDLKLEAIITNLKKLHKHLDITL